MLLKKKGVASAPVELAVRPRHVSLEARVNAARVEREGVEARGAVALVQLARVQHVGELGVAVRDPRIVDSSTRDERPRERRACR
jgi:hypothetical protein